MWSYLVQFSNRNNFLILYLISSICHSVVSVECEEDNISHYFDIDEYFIFLKITLHCMITFYLGYLFNYISTNLTNVIFFILLYYRCILGGKYYPVGFRWIVCYYCDCNFDNSAQKWRSRIGLSVCLMC